MRGKKLQCDEGRGDHQDDPGEPAKTNRHTSILHPPVKSAILKFQLKRLDHLLGVIAMHDRRSHLALFLRSIILSETRIHAIYQKRLLYPCRSRRICRQALATNSSGFAPPRSLRIQVATSLSGCPIRRLPIPLKNWNRSSFLRSSTDPKTGHRVMRANHLVFR